MPQAQIINFGEDPYANAMGGFAESFLGEINERTAKKRNEDIFAKIKSKYGKDADPKDIFKDVLEAEGLDQEYKRNKLNEIKDYAALSTKNKKTPYQEAMLQIREEELNLKKNKAQTEAEGKPLTSYQKKVLSNQEIRLAQDKLRIENAAKSEDRKLPEYIEKYTSSLLKDGGVSLPVSDKSTLNNFVQDLMTEEGLGVNDAFNRAYNYIQARREKIDSVQITPKPSAWSRPSEQEIQQNMEQAFNDLKKLHDEDGIDNQADLRSIAKRAGWAAEETNMLLQKIFQMAGKSLMGAPVKGSKVSGSEQGVASQAEGLDDILFGE